MHVVGVGHSGLELHAFCAQVTSQAHESLQSSAAHDACPEQVTLHWPAPHCTSLQDSTPLHDTVHDVAPPQSSLSHEPWREQLTLHAQPVGHVTLLPPSIAQVFALTSQVVHAAGHPLLLLPLPLPVTTHSPPLQVRPLEQSAWTAQV